MTPEHFQLIISDLYEENYKSDFAKDLRENIDDLTDFDWIRQIKTHQGVGGDWFGTNVGGDYFGINVGSISGGGHGDYVGGDYFGINVGIDNGINVGGDSQS